MREAKSQKCVGHVRPRHPRSFRFMEGFGVHTFRLSTPRGVDVREVPLEAQGRPAVGRVGRGGAVNGAEPRLPRRDLWDAIGAGTFPSGSSASSSSTMTSPTASTSTSSTRPSSFPRAGAGSAGGRWFLTRWWTTSSPRRSRSRSAPRTVVPGSTSPTTRSCRAELLLPRHPAQAPRQPHFVHLPVTPPSARWPCSNRTGTCDGQPAGRANYEPTRGPRRRGAPGGSRPGFQTYAAEESARSAGSAPSCRRQTPGPAVLCSQTDVDSHIGPPHLRAQQVQRL